MYCKKLSFFYLSIILISKLKATQVSEDSLLHHKTNDINNCCHLPVNRTVLISLCINHSSADSNIQTNVNSGLTSPQSSFSLSLLGGARGVMGRRKERERESSSLYLPITPCFRRARHAKMTENESELWPCYYDSD